MFKVVSDMEPGENPQGYCSLCVFTTMKTRAGAKKVAAILNRMGGRKYYVL